MEERTNIKKYSTAISGIKLLTKEANNVLLTLSKITYVSPKTDSELKQVLTQYDIFWFRLNHKLTREILTDVKCKYIVCAATGLDHIDITACNDFGIRVISLKDEAKFLKEVRATAEHTLNLMLTLIKKSKKAYNHVESGQWNRNLFQGRELYKKNIGILGYGRLGKIVADYTEALGMQVYYYDIESKKSKSTHNSCGSLSELSEKSDILSIHIPYNSDTHHLLNKVSLSNLKQTSNIINTSRGGVINENDVLNLLENNKIAGYATDVLYGEPNISNHPLVAYAQENENVIITPHIGGNTYESIEKTEYFVAKKLRNSLL